MGSGDLGILQNQVIGFGPAYPDGLLAQDYFFLVGLPPDYLQRGLRKGFFPPDVGRRPEGYGRLIVG
jgi:hypothetical protein